MAYRAAVAVALFAAVQAVPVAEPNPNPLLGLGGGTSAVAAVTSAAGITSAAACAATVPPVFNGLGNALPTGLSSINPSGLSQISSVLSSLNLPQASSLAGINNFQQLTSVLGGVPVSDLSPINSALNSVAAAQLANAVTSLVPTVTGLPQLTSLPTGAASAISSALQSLGVTSGLNQLTAFTNAVQVNTFLQNLNLPSTALPALSNVLTSLQPQVTGIIPTVTNAIPTVSVSGFLSVTVIPTAAVPSLTAILSGLPQASQLATVTNLVQFNSILGSLPNSVAPQVNSILNGASLPTGGVQSLVGAVPSITALTLPTGAIPSLSAILTSLNLPQAPQLSIITNPSQLNSFINGLPISADPAINGLLQSINANPLTNIAAVTNALPAVTAVPTNLGALSSALSAAGISQVTQLATLTGLPAINSFFQGLPTSFDPALTGIISSLNAGQLTGALPTITNVLPSVTALPTNLGALSSALAAANIPQVTQLATLTGLPAINSFFQGLPTSFDPALSGIISSLNAGQLTGAIAQVTAPVSLARISGLAAGALPAFSNFLQSAGLPEATQLGSITDAAGLASIISELPPAAQASVYSVFYSVQVGQLTKVLPTYVFPSNVIALPTGAVPTGIIPTGILPTGIIPTGGVPTGALPTGILGTGLASLPQITAFPSAAIPSLSTLLQSLNAPQITGLSAVTDLPSFNQFLQNLPSSDLAPISTFLNSVQLSQLNQLPTGVTSLLTGIPQVTAFPTNLAPISALLQSLSLPQANSLGAVTNLAGLNSFLSGLPASVDPAVNALLQTLPLTGLPTGITGLPTGITGLPTGVTSLLTGVPQLTAFPTNLAPLSTLLQALNLPQASSLGSITNLAGLNSLLSGLPTSVDPAVNALLQTLPITALPTGLPTNVAGLPSITGIAQLPTLTAFPTNQLPAFASFLQSVTVPNAVLPTNLAQLSSLESLLPATALPAFNNLLQSIQIGQLPPVTNLNQLPSFSAFPTGQLSGLTSLFSVLNLPQSTALPAITNLAALSSLESALPTSALPGLSSYLQNVQLAQITSAVPTITAFPTSILSQISTALQNINLGSQASSLGAVTNYAGLASVLGAAPITAAPGIASVLSSLSLPPLASLAAITPSVSVNAIGSVTLAAPTGLITQLNLPSVLTYTPGNIIPSGVTLPGGVTSIAPSFTSLFYLPAITSALAACTGVPAAGM